VTTLRTLILLLLVSAGTVFAQSPEQVFQQGNMLYQQGSLEEARKAYETLLGQGYVSGELYYNLGNVYYRTGNIARGILFYERAARLIPQDEDLQHNLALANLRITDRIEPTPRLFIWDAWEGLKHTLSLQGLTWLTFFGYLVVIAFVALLLLGGSFTVRRVGLIGTAVTGVLFLLLLGMFIGRLADLGATDEAILMASVATVKNSPDPKSSDAFVLHSGVKLWVIDRVSEWVKIRLADGKQGWVERSSIEVI
jgi:tetratricopeptide (TPR) repeat protein